MILEIDVPITVIPPQIDLYAFLDLPAAIAITFPLAIEIEEYVVQAIKDLEEYITELLNLIPNLTIHLVVTLNGAKIIDVTLTSSISCILMPKLAIQLPAIPGFVFNLPKLSAELQAGIPIPPIPTIQLKACVP
jgi:hypothetical protein